MIVLITGASHVGKTVLAQRILEKYAFPYFSIDHLKMGLIRSGNTDLTPEDDEAITEYLWPIVREMVKTAIENRQNLVIEGCYIPPDWRGDFEEEYLRSIEFVCLAMSDAYINAHIVCTLEAVNTPCVLRCRCHCPCVPYAILVIACAHVICHTLCKFGYALALQDALYRR